MRNAMLLGLFFVLSTGCAYGITGEETDAAGNSIVGSSSSGGCGAGSTSPKSTSFSSSSSSSSSSTSSSSSSSSSTGSSGGGCDQHGDCYDCANCSLGTECAAEANACTSDPDCTDFNDCLAQCYDDICANDCAAQHPTGSNLYMAMTQCAFCNACPSDCAVESQGLCGP